MGGPKGWLYVLMELGDSFFCAPDDCAMAFFGLETRGDDTRLHSFSTHGNAALAKAVRALQARFKGLCEQLNTGWDDFATNQNFERWLLDRKTAAPGGEQGDQAES